MQCPLVASAVTIWRWYNSLILGGFHLIYVLNYVLKAVFGGYLHFLEQVINDLFQVAAGMQQVQPTYGASHLDQNPMAGQDKFT